MVFGPIGAGLNIAKDVTNIGKDMASLLGGKGGGNDMQVGQALNGNNETVKGNNETVKMEVPVKLAATVGNIINSNA